MMSAADNVPTPLPENDASSEPATPGTEGYRLFFVNSDDKFQGFQVYVGASDTEALERARAALQHHPYAVAIEVWKRGLLVGRIDR
jgi:hypothetical protein